MTQYYKCPKCREQSLVRIITGLEFPDYPEIEEYCDLCGFTDAR